MDSAVATNSGIMSWVSSVRMSMANDPGRRHLEDQIQKDGFLFLEDYLESILARPKLDPIIELVKTPARRRNFPKTKGGTGLARLAITMDLDEVDSDKENEVPHVNETPMNAFHKTLLETRDQNLSAERQLSSGKAVPPHRPEPPSLPSLKMASKADRDTSSATLTVEQILTDDEEVEENVVEKFVSPPRSRTPEAHRQSGSASQSLPSTDSPVARQSPAQARGHTELPVMTNDEPLKDRSDTVSELFVNESPKHNASTAERSTKSSRSQKPYLQRTPPNIDMENIMDIEDITQTINFNTISAPAQSETAARPASNSVAAPETIGSAGSSQSPRSSRRQHETAPLPSNETATNTDANDHTDKPPVKPHVTEFPTIGPPSPLRRSTRVAKESMPATAHAPPMTKPVVPRSSWLVKAREAKAIEEGNKRQTILSAYLHHTAAGSKRKSGDMLDTEWTGVFHNDTGRTQKLTKIAEASPVALKEQDRAKEKQLSSRYRDDVISIADDEMRENTTPADGSDGMIDKLKKTVAGFSARAGRSMGKSLGGAAATALAEAVAAAEAKVAERNAAEGRPVPASSAVLPHEEDDAKVATSASAPAFSEASQRESGHRASRERDRRFSVSDLVSKFDAKSTKTRRVFQPQPTATTGHKSNTADASTSTTPPNSPPKARPPVFTLPAKPKLPPVQTCFAPPITQVFSRIEPQPSGPSRDLQIFHSQSTLYTTQPTFSDVVFDHEMPAWVPSTQDTDLSDHGPTQSTMCSAMQKDGSTNADESWHLDANFGETWTPITYSTREDDMTWSSAPTRSTRSAEEDNFSDTILPPPLKPKVEAPSDAGDPAFEAIPSDNPPCTDTDGMDDEDMDVDYDEDMASVRLVTPAPQPKKHRNSEWPTPERTDKGVSSNTGGFFSSASKLVSSVLGGSKKGVEPVKSLQLAAVAAKKQQEGAEKKATRLKEMETRRQQALQKRAEDEKVREEKKAKEENERWKRERGREDLGEKRIIKQPSKKPEEQTKKRKVAETEKKIEPKKLLLKDKKDAPVTKIGKFNPSASQTAANATASSSKPIKQTPATSTQTSITKVGHVGNEAKPRLNEGKGKMKDAEIGSKQPSQLMHSQMQARYKAQIEDTRKAQMAPPPVNTESIELPDINSEYSDSDDENRTRHNLPHWAQSPELREALESQKTVNPDDIFGAIRPLKMEELFKNRNSRFRARTSSANWAGTDGLTIHEEIEYARRMGYRQ